MIFCATGWGFPFGAATAKSRNGELPVSQLRQILPLGKLLSYMLTLKQ